jgi:putative acetyltransferase
MWGLISSIGLLLKKERHSNRQSRTRTTRYLHVGLFDCSAAMKVGMLRRMEVCIDELSSPDVLALLTDHLTDMALHSPAESIHALQPTDLQQADVTFWTVRDQGELAGCGALKDLGNHHGELKSMRTAPAHRRKGVARLLLQHILTEAAGRGFTRLSLETGSADAFHPARELYRSFGFINCDPFDRYIEDTHSVFMTLEMA